MEEDKLARYFRLRYSALAEAGRGGLWLLYHVTLT
jgi:hypothetical protein